MAEEWFNPRPTSGLDVQALLNLCPQGMYYRFIPSELPQYFSSGLIATLDGGIMVHSGSLFMINLFRIDGADIDQQPFGFVVASGVASASGGFIQHGDWIGRTIPQPPEMASAIAASGIGHGQFFSGLPTNPTGPVSDLGPSNCAAFEKLASYMSGLLS
jgi:hypothetical protein